ASSFRKTTATARTTTSPARDRFLRLLLLQGPERAPAVGGPDLAHDRGDVTAHGDLRRAQAQGDLAGGDVLEQKGGDLQLAAREFVGQPRGADPDAVLAG